METKKVKIKKLVDLVLAYEPDIDEVKKYGFSLYFANFDFNASSEAEALKIVDLILRVTNAYRILKGNYDLKTASKIAASVEERWKDGIPQVVWRIEGFRGYKK